MNEETVFDLNSNLYLHNQPKIICSLSIQMQRGPFYLLHLFLVLLIYSWELSFTPKDSIRIQARPCDILYLLYRYWWNSTIFLSSRAVKIPSLSFTCEDIGVAMVTNMISQLQESFPFRRAVGSFEIKKSCLLCRNFISIYKIKRTLHGRLGIRLYLRVLKVSLTNELRSLER